MASHNNPLQADKSRPLQCLDCRKQRVKCDFTRPTCRRCHNDKISCRGYQKELKIIPFHGPGGLQSSRSIQPNTQHQSQKTEDALTTIVTPPVYDRDESAVLDSIVNYNKYVVPSISPAHHPFKRRLMGRDVPWQVLPKVLQYLTVVTLRSIQASRDGIDPSQQRDISHYRSLVLSELKLHLPEATRDPWGVTLGSILLLMGTDLHAEPEGSWLFHFHAAGRIIDLRGGLRKCLDALLYLRVPLINYMVIDIFTATTSKSDFVFMNEHASSAHADYRYLIPGIAADIIAYSHACPPEILSVVSLVNLLRCSAQSVNIVKEDAENLAQIRASTDFDSTLKIINAFDAARWAEEVLQHGQILPLPLEKYFSVAETFAFTCLGSAYQSAALLYLILSLRSDIDEDWKLILQSAKQNLDEQTDRLFSTATHDNDGPLEGQLWKFLAWPMIISVFARVGWDLVGVTSGTCRNSVCSELDLLQVRADLLRSKRLKDAVKHFRAIRVLRDGYKDVNSWTWNDGFFSRAAFGL